MSDEGTPQPYVYLTVNEDGSVTMDTNMGDAWQVVILKVAKKLKEDLM